MSRCGALLLLLGLAGGCSELPRPLQFDGPVGGDSGPRSERGGRDGGPKPVFDWRDGVMYFVMLDRFLDGDSANNKPEPDVEQPANYQGGDLAGLLQQLKAGIFDQLGINVLWLSSPVDAPEGKYLGKDGHYYAGYHGYWPVELDKVETRLGDLALLQKVVAEAHSRGIRVVIDYVMNHVHESSSLYKQHSDWFWPLDLGGKQCICGAGCSWDPPEGLRCWFDPFLPDFDFQNTQARAFSVGNAMDWVNKAAVDGFRLDAVKHIETSWLTDLRSRLTTERQGPVRFYLIGETFDGNRDLLKQFIDPPTKLDGQFDFPLRAVLVKVLLMRQSGMQELDSFLASNDGYYGQNAVMGTFLGNHDLPRAIHLAEDTPLFGEWDTGKSRAWTNLPSLPSYAAPFERLAVAFTAILTLPGLPTIYYGDEIGMPGGGDPDDRHTMVWSGTTPQQDKLRGQVKRLIEIRRQHPALRRGTRQQVWITNDLYAYRMTQDSDSLVVVLNRSDNEQSFQLSGQASFKDLLSGESLPSGTIKVPPRSARILQ